MGVDRLVEIGQQFALSLAVAACRGFWGLDRLGLALWRFDGDGRGGQCDVCEGRQRRAGDERQRQCAADVWPAFVRGGPNGVEHAMSPDWQDRVAVFGLVSRTSSRYPVTRSERIAQGYVSRCHWRWREGTGRALAVVRPQFVGNFGQTPQEGALRTNEEAARRGSPRRVARGWGNRKNTNRERCSPQRTQRSQRVII